MNQTIVTLREITANTVLAICDLETNEHQSDFVAPNAVSIAQAHFAPPARFRAVYAGETPVGFIMWRPADDASVCYLWRFMIDRHHQEKGYGRAALALLMTSARTDGFKRMLTSYVVGDAGPREFYIKLGFGDTGESRPNGERLMDMAL
jgi:diamine N-acetyltransferase